MHAKLKALHDLASGSYVLLGIMLLASPLLGAYQLGEPLLIVILLGALISALGAWRFSRPALYIDIALGLLGAWLLVSSYWLFASRIGFWSGTLVGMGISLTALLAFELYGNPVESGKPRSGAACS